MICTIPPEWLALPLMKVKPEIFAKRAAETPVTTNAALPLAASVMFVCPMPAPVRVKPLFVIVTVLVHVQFPAGTVTVSPAAAELIALWTAVSVQDAAATVAASADVTKPIINEKRITTVQVTNEAGAGCPVGIKLLKLVLLTADIPKNR